MKTDKIQLIKILKDSFELLKKEPKLFLPKLLIAILYGILIIFQAQILLQFVTIFSGEMTTQQIQQIIQILFFSIILLISNILVYLLDTLITATYPALVKQFPKKISFKKAIKESKNNYLKAIISSIILLTITMIISTLITIPFILTNQTNPNIQIIISLSVGFVIVFLFYLLFPVLMLEKKGIIYSIKKSITMSFKNKKNILALSLLPLTITLTKLLLAIFITHPLALILFILLVIITALLHTYSTVATQTTYFSLKNN